MELTIPARPIGLISQLWAYPLAVLADARHPPTSSTLHERLNRAARLCQYAMAKRCLSQGANPNLKNAKGSPLVVAAAFYGQRTLLRALADAGADLNATENYGWTALSCAAEKGDENIVRFLLDRGADVNAKGDTGRTALIEAADAGHTGTVRLLLDRGADPSLASCYGDTALGIAQKKYYDDIARLIAAAMPPPAAPPPAASPSAPAAQPFNVSSAPSAVATAQAINISRPLTLKAQAGAATPT